ncbi:hypothetical protein HLH34_00060 [Gluconacetobacter azotocaptans]|uniref:Uncharacterized protein n=1 Tax=Gluconacetobacter azotocaptans TaxID=142834 RepID=A0A7W4JP62_9PROT|nr:hypothetical protein [Gluconacetobacter azotocaptans]MBB2188364.1 hypothetical protein [Gluconacetobacter azotocaptans]GBQ27642.1 hypothetical protein AA13594_0675 [Gluconacetobacter azotocaptans DSM 13594]
MTALQWTPGLQELAAACRSGTLYGRPEAPAEQAERRARFSRLAAHLAVRNQMMWLGPPGVDEETQTAALFGLLATALSTVTLLARGDGGVGGQGREPGCYWAHQRKRADEPRTGGDFGVICDLGDGDVKLTLFQAKRPWEGDEFEDLRMDHQVHSSKPDTPPADTPASEQKQALDLVVQSLAAGDGLDDAVEQLIEHSLWQAALCTGPESLFVPAYSYRQSTALLAAALHGWNSDCGRAGWCFYVQWPYGEAREPWAISAVAALGPRGGRGAMMRGVRFVDVLAHALSPVCQDIGWILPRRDVAVWAPIISGLMPGLVWGGSAETAEGAAALVRELAGPQADIRQIPQGPAVAAPAPAPTPGVRPGTTGP